MAVPVIAPRCRCGKIGHRSVGAAQEHLLDLVHQAERRRGEPGWRGARYEVYSCPDVPRLWHVGHIPDSHRMPVP